MARPHTRNSSQQFLSGFLSGLAKSVNDLNLLTPVREEKKESESQEKGNGTGISARGAMEAFSGAVNSPAKDGTGGSFLTLQKTELTKPVKDDDPVERLDNYSDDSYDVPRHASAVTASEPVSITVPPQQQLPEEQKCYT